MLLFKHILLSDLYVSWQFHIRINSQLEQTHVYIFTRTYVIFTVFVPYLSSIRPVNQLKFSFDLAGILTGTGAFPAQMASNAENVSI